MTKIIVAFRNFAKAPEKKAALKKKLNKQNDSHNLSLTLQAPHIMAFVVTDNVQGIPHCTDMLSTAFDRLLITQTMCRMFHGQERKIF